MLTAECFCFPITCDYGDYGVYGDFPCFSDHGDDALEWFYLGGLDAWRVAFNSDYGQRFVPAKHAFRSDNVDSQRGEVEWSGGNLYYDQWNYSFDWSPVAQP